jgi:hypothetical protein
MSDEIDRVNREAIEKRQRDLARRYAMTDKSEIARFERLAENCDIEAQRIAESLPRGMVHHRDARIHALRDMAVVFRRYAAAPPEPAALPDEAVADNIDYDYSTAFTKWWTEITAKGDPSRRPYLVKEAFIAGWWAGQGLE